MGKRGPKPKPSALKKLAGNPGKRRLNKAEPKPAPIDGPAEPPDWLDLDARDEWARVAPELSRLGILTKIDLSLLAAYCLAYAEMVVATRQLQEMGTNVVVVKNDDGTIKYMQPAPHVGIAHRAALRMRTLAAEMGITPSARTRLVTETDGPTKQDDQTLRLFGQ